MASAICVADEHAVIVAGWLSIIDNSGAATAHRAPQTSTWAARVPVVLGPCLSLAQAWPCCTTQLQSADHRLAPTCIHSTCHTKLLTKYMLLQRVLRCAVLCCDVLHAGPGGVPLSSFDPANPGALSDAEPSIKACPNGMWTQDVASFVAQQCCE